MITLILIKNGYLLEPESGYEGEADLLIEGERIRKIFYGGGADPAMIVDDELQVIDAEGLCVAPGLVDVHVHFREPGFEYKEDIASGAEAAARGGYTTVVLMANTKPLVDNAETLQYVIQKAEETGIHVRTCAAVSKNFAGKEFVEYKEMLSLGAVGFTDDGMPLMDEAFLEEAMKKIKAFNVPISLHEENPALISENGINRGKASEHFHIGGSPREAEISMVERDIELAKKTGATLNIQHISCKETVEMIRKAKAQGYDNIHGEATPHHFTLTEEAVITHGTMAKMNPPLRQEDDRQAIIRALKEGVLEIIATDHAPHSKEEKERELTKAPSGILGLETALSLGIGELVEKNGMPLLDLIHRMSYFPAKMYHLEAGYLKEQGPADIILFDPNELWRVEKFASKSQNSPFLGKMMLGKVKLTICKGKIVYQEQE